MQLDGAPVSTERNTVMGVYPAKNGRWSYLHCNFPNHRAALPSAWRAPEDREAVRQAVAQWDALALEEAIIAAHGAGAWCVRWPNGPSTHTAIASLPLMEIVKIGDSPPEQLPDGDRPLSGVRVLDLTRVLAGPTCARTLAEHGADVLKITAAHLPNIGYQEYDTGHGKLSAHLDLRQPQDLEDLARAGPRATCSRKATGRAPSASVDSRPRRWRNCGLASSLSRCPPSAMSGVGIAPRLRHGGADGQRHYQPPGRAVSRRSAGPQFYPVSAIDYLTGYLMAFGAMVALAGRVREGGSWLVRISLRRPGAGSSDAARCRRPSQGRAEGIHPRRAGALVDDERYAGRSAAPSRAGGASLRDTAAWWPSVPLGYHEPVWPARAA